MKYRLANSSSFMVDLLNRAILVQSYPHGQFLYYLYFTLLNQKVGLVVSTCPLRSPPSLAPAGPPSSHSASVVLAPEGEKSYTLTLPTERTPVGLSWFVSLNTTRALGRSTEINSEWWTVVENECFEGSDFETHPYTQTSSVLDVHWHSRYLCLFEANCLYKCVAVRHRLVVGFG